MAGLLPKFRFTPAGHSWAGDRMAALVEKAGPPQVLARQILIVEAHGYHAKEWQRPPALSPGKSYGFRSQRYGIWLVKEAVDREALIVVVLGSRRSEGPRYGEWARMVGDLATYRNAIWNPHRAARISRSNFGESFDDIVAALRRDRQ